MIVVIIAGGAGTRLWPLSTPEYPKHLLKINGDEYSLLQQTYNRAKKLSDKVYVASEASHIKHVKDQLPDLTDDKFIIEPARQGTANCIVAALCHVSKRHSSNEPVVFLSADHYIRDTEGFAHSFKIASEASIEENRIVLVGVEPTYPATGFGYIEKGTTLNEKSFVYNVNSFKEKPSFDLAKTYIRSGHYLWNCGYFIGTIDTFKNSMGEFAPELLNTYNKLCNAKGDDFKNIYLSLKKDTIDYALIEKISNLLVVPASFDWMDLGSFTDLHKAVDSDENGNHLHGDNIEVEEVENALIQNYDSKPLAVIGLDNVVVINTKSGILVARKDLAQKVGDVSKRIHGNK